MATQRRLCRRCVGSRQSGVILPHFGRHLSEMSGNPTQRWLCRRCVAARHSLPILPRFSAVFSRFWHFLVSKNVSVAERVTGAADLSAAASGNHLRHTLPYLPKIR